MENTIIAIEKARKEDEKLIEDLNKKKGRVENINLEKNQIKYFYRVRFK